MELFTITFFTTAAIFVFSLYLLSLHPTISGGDSGELVAEGCILGVAHPPGYPLYTLIVHSLSKLALTTSVAYIVNIFSAFCTTLSSILMGLIVYQLSGIYSYAGSVVTIGMFCFSPLIWQYAVTAEVFPLNTLFSSIIIYLTLQYGLYRSYKVLYLGALACGLGLCNQHTIILFEIPCILWILWLIRHELRIDPIILLRVGLSFLIGLLPYVTLPIVSFLHPQPGSWGNVTTVTGFLHHFLRKDYGTFKLFSGASGKASEGFWERNEAYFVDAFFVQGLYIIPLLSFIGMIFSSFPTSDSFSPTFSDSNTIEPPSTTTGSKNNVSKRSRKPAAISTSTTKSINKSPFNVKDTSSTTNNNNNNFNTNLSAVTYFPMVMLATYLFYFIVFHSLSNLPLSDKLLYGIHQRFWMQPNIILFIFAGLGMNIITNWIIFLFDILNRKQTKKIGPRNILQNRFNKDNENIDNQQQYTSSITKHWFTGLAMAGAVYLVTRQYQENLFLSDQSTAFHFRQYAHALLNPLPSGSVFLINYDMQWTAVRYVQQCEHHRPDITSINLSMMTYKWFASKHFLYPNITFPGTFHGAEDSLFVHREGAFTMYQFLNANIHKQLPIFLSGKFSFKDSLFDKYYEQVPIGLVSELLPEVKVFNASVYYKTIMKKWRKVMLALPTLPDPVKYPEETWEWTIGRDFKDRVGDTAAFLLERAIPTASTDPLPLVGAVYWMESTLLLETLPDAASSSAPSPPRPVSVHLLKNLGLAHVHLVQCKALSGDRPLPLPTHDLFGTLSQINWPVLAKQSTDGILPVVSIRWKEWSSERFAFAWGAFLKHPDAKRDPQYQTIKNMYETATRTIIS